ncbi:unnamed protein product [Arctogadus glacialis]
MEKKRKGGAEKLRDKKRQALEENGAKCAKISDMFAATAGPASLAPPPTTFEIAAAEAKQDVGGGDGEGIEWRPRPRAAIESAGGLGSGDVAGCSRDVPFIGVDFTGILHICLFWREGLPSPDVEFTCVLFVSLAPRSMQPFVSAYVSTK